MFQRIEYDVAGRAFAALLAAPPGTPRGGVLVCHGGGGLGDHERDQVRLLAALGYTALAPDLFGEQFCDRAHGMRVIGELVAAPTAVRDRATAAWAVLAGQPGVAATAAIGHCFGGLAALELARTGADLRAVVSYHGNLTTKQPGAIRARVLACSGADDPYCPPDQRAAFEHEMTAAGVDWQHHVYGGVRHGFTVPGIEAPNCAYDARAAGRAWRATLSLFDESLG